MTIIIWSPFYRTYREHRDGTLAGCLHIPRGRAGELLWLRQRSCRVRPRCSLCLYVYILWVRAVSFGVAIPSRFSAFGEFAAAIHTNADWILFSLNWFLYYFAAVARPARRALPRPTVSPNRSWKKKWNENMIMANAQRYNLYGGMEMFRLSTSSPMNCNARYCRLLRLFRLCANDVLV